MIFSKNRKASHDYHLNEFFVAGMVLEGPEVKSIRNGNISLKESYVKIEDGEAFLMQAHITKPEYVTHTHFDEVRKRKLLLTKKEINKLHKETQEQGVTIIAIKVFQPDTTNSIKIEIALATGKRDWDKRNSLKEKQQNIDTARQMKDY